MSMKKCKIYADRMYKRGNAEEGLFGSFLEHMGRVIYTGIYEKDNKNSDEDGFRKDVLEAVKEMGVKYVRYPGGNFVSNYCWEDGVGEPKNRPRKLDLAWRSVETNEFGTNEFMKWAKKAEVNPIMTVNLGTRGVADAINLLEYCNFPEGTYYSDLRRGHGFTDPYGIKIWSLGNEMDGEWQIGHKTAGEYGRLAAETGRAMKRFDPDIKLIVCGSSLSSMDTYPQWDFEVLQNTYDIADYLALHQYYGGQEKGTAEFLAQSLDMDKYIETIESVVQLVKAEKRSKKNVYLSMDEWGVWAVPGDTVNKELEEIPWQIAPAISEQIYTLEDSLLFAELMMCILRHSDSIKIACQSLLTNISACIMTEKNGGYWVQPNYYPFKYISKYGKGTILESRYMGDGYETESFENVPYADQLMVLNEGENELVVFLVNRCEEELNVDIDLLGICADHIIESIVMTHEDKKATNLADHNNIVPQVAENVVKNDNNYQTQMAPLSFQMIRFNLQ